jgi:CubicO group peptidase (beta-lactamase class C family)
MITSGGRLGDVRIFSPETVELFTGAQTLKGHYRLGWETMCAEAPEEGEPCSSPAGIGHTGWTGTSIWIDPDRGIWTVLLTNRTYEPRASNQLQEVRRELFARATGRTPLLRISAAPADSANPPPNLD